jgi:hypothetical protein
MKKTIEYTECDYCHQRETETRNPIQKYRVVGAGGQELSEPTDLHADCVKKFYGFAVFLGHYTKIHVGLEKQE